MLGVREVLHHLVEALVQANELQGPALSDALAIVALADARKGGGQVLQRPYGAAQRPIDEGQHKGAEDGEHAEREPDVAPYLGHLVVGVGLQDDAAEAIECRRQLRAALRRSRQKIEKPGRRGALRLGELGSLGDLAVDDEKGAQVAVAVESRRRADPSAVAD